MSKAYNRHQAEKALKKARKLATRFIPNDPVAAEKNAHRMRDNRKPCSCNMCRNPRRSIYYKGKGKLTLQELKAREDYTANDQAEARGTANSANQKPL